MVNEETLSGRSPSALPIGIHDVEVLRTTETDTQTSVLPAAFEVLDTPEEEDDPTNESDGTGSDVETEEPRADEMTASETEKDEKRGCSHTPSGLSSKYVFAMLLGILGLRRRSQTLGDRSANKK